MTTFKNITMKIGFTGSSTKVTSLQELSLIHILDKWVVRQVHHGDCIVADAIFHETCLRLNISLIGHPPLNDKKRAFCQGFTEIREPKGYLDRNKDIVDETDILIAMPDSYKEKLRSGTWSTIRYAIKQNKQVYIIYPNGSVEIK